VKELTLSNKLMQERMEMLEARQGDEIELDVGLLSNGDISVKNSNKTIAEVDEGDERSDIENSLDGEPRKNSAKGSAKGHSVRGRNSSLYRPRDARRAEFAFNSIAASYSFTRGRPEEHASPSPRSSSTKKHIFSADSIIKNISALRKSEKGEKGDVSRDARGSVQEFVPVVPRKLKRVNKLLSAVSQLTQRINIGACVDKVVSLEERVKQLQSVLADQDIESLARPKRDSNLQALTERSHSSRSQSYYVDVDEPDEEGANVKPTSAVRTQQAKLKAGDKPGKNAPKPGNLKKSGRLEKIIKPHATISPAKKAQPRAGKDAQAKPSRLHASSVKKDARRSNVDAEAVEDELRAQIEELRAQQGQLVSELDFLKEKSQREEDVLRRAFDIALPLIEEQLEDAVDLDHTYLDQIVEVVKTKVSRYEEALDSLQHEVEALRQGYPEHSDEDAADEERTERLSARHADDKSLVEVDLEGEPQDGPAQDPEQLNDMKKAFDELICEMFTVTADNIDIIGNLEAYVAGEHEDESETLEANMREDVAGELDKIKTFTLRLKEMIEVLYENLMTYMSDAAASKTQGALAGDEVSVANLQAENEYLCKRLETFNENYQDLNKKYLHLLGEKNAALGKSTSSPQFEYAEEAPSDDTLKEKMRKFIQNNIDFAHGAPEELQTHEEQAAGEEYEATADEQIYQLTYLLRRINQIIKSDNTDNYKIMKVEDILENPEAQ